MRAHCDEKGIVGHIREIRGRHADFLTIKGVFQFPGFRGSEDGLGVPLANGIPFGTPHEGAQSLLGLFLAPIGESEDMVLVRAHLFTSVRGGDHDGAVERRGKTEAMAIRNVFKCGGGKSGGEVDDGTSQR